MAKQKHIVLGVTGSIAAYKAGDVIRRLREKGFKVSVAMTKDAEHFITPLTLSSLAGSQVYRDMFEDSASDWTMPHIELAESADVVAIVPATANIIGKLAHGLASDLISCIVLGTKAKVLIAPAMNTHMYKNKIVQDNCAKLRANKFSFIEPIAGKLACGTTGQGHIAEVDDIVKAIIKAAK